MPREHHRVAIFAVSRAPVTRWATRGFAPSAALDDAPPLEPGVRLTPPGDVETWYVGSAEVMLHSGETGHYRDNLRAARPRLWVALKRGGAAPALAMATVDPYEGEALAGDDGLVVEAVDLPPRLADAMRAFIAAHHVERVFEKRKRKAADPEALARRGPHGAGPDR
ncbi:MAG: DUF3305 domain-containing protein [Rubrimonas sp.]